MFQLKPISPDGVDAALQRAERYRLLNEPWEAESICHDVLHVEPDNARALMTLLLAMTDQFDEGGADAGAAQALLPRLPGEYERAYYGGVICERWAKRLLAQRAPGSGPVVYRWLEQAMASYDRAERLRPPGDDDAILRWNTCARLLMRHPAIRPAPADEPAALELE